MRISAVQSHRSTYDGLGTWRYRMGTSRSLLVMRLRFRNQHISNHFPYAQVGRIAPHPLPIESGTVASQFQWVA
jgi:hypothetical protein